MLWFHLYVDWENGRVQSWKLGRGFVSGSDRHRSSSQLYAADRLTEVLVGSGKKHFSNRLNLWELNWLYNYRCIFKLLIFSRVAMILMILLSLSEDNKVPFVICTRWPALKLVLTILICITEQCVKKRITAARPFLCWLNYKHNHFLFIRSR